MESVKTNVRKKENGLMDILMSRYIPYWPILIFFLVICFVAAIAYMRFANPTYEATATLLIKDEKKGYEDSQIMESLNIFAAKKIVENEIEVIQSRALMKDVVKSLRLYAPVYREGRLRSASAYISSPIIIEVKDHEKITEDIDKVYFIYDRKNESVKMNEKTYSLNQWEKTEYGELKFIPNTKERIAGPEPLYFSLIPPKKVVSNMLKKLNVSAANKLSSVVNLQFADEVPEKAEDVLNALINAYNNAGIDDKTALANNTLEFVDERLHHVKNALDSVEKQIQSYRSNEGVFNLGEQSSLFLRNVGDNDQKLGVIDMQLSVLGRVEKYLNSGKTKSTIVPSNLDVNDPILTQLLQRLYEAEIEYEKLKYTTAENNPIMISLVNEIQRIKPTIIENIGVQKMNLIARRNQLNETNKSYSSTLTSIPEKERKLLEISREQSIINNVYNFLLQKREETALSNASTVPDSRVLDVAESSIKPIGPKKIIAFPVALVFAFILTFMVVTFKDYLSSKIIFRYEIENLTNIPIVGEVSYIKNNKNIIPENSKLDVVTFQIHQIIASTGLYLKNNSRKKILIKSSVEGEGKSFISANLASTLASSGKKVVLVDFDLNNSTISDFFGIHKGPGISEYISGEKEAFDVIHTSSNPNLFILGSGKNAANTSIHHDDRLENLFKFLEQSFDVIVIDSAPIDPVSDALLLTQYTDLALHVVRHRLTPIIAIQKLNNENTQPNIGIIFNGVKSRGFFKGYDYGNGFEINNKKKSFSPNKITKAVNTELEKQA